MPTLSLEKLFDRTAVVSWMRQLRFESQIADRVWWVDPQNGIAKLYTPDRRQSGEPLSIQVIGTEGGGEWLWGWGNPLNATSPDALIASQRMRSIGLEYDLSELTSSTVVVDALANARSFAMIALSLSAAAGYVLHRAGPLVAVFLVDDESFRTADEIDFIALAKAVNAVIAAGLPVSNARDLIEGALDGLEIRYEGGASVIDAQNATGQLMQVTFDGDRHHFKIQ